MNFYLLLITSTIIITGKSTHTHTHICRTESGSHHSSCSSDRSTSDAGSDYTDTHSLSQMKEDEEK